MTEHQICKCPRCGTPHLVWIQDPLIEPQILASMINARNASKVAEELNKVWKEGYDIAKCQEPVSNDDWQTEYQCPRSNGYGLEKAWCKQHAKGHPVL